MEMVQNFIENTRHFFRRNRNPSFQDMSDDFHSLPDSEKPPLDRDTVDESKLTDIQKTWRKDGIVILKNFIPDDIIDAYCEVRKTAPVEGFAPVPYIHLKEVRDLCLYPPLVEVLQSLIMEDPVLHLILSTWKSTQRAWHQDTYLHPTFVKGHYLAIWAVLEDIDADAGPYEYCPGSHRKLVLNRDKVKAQLPPHQARQNNHPGDKGHWAHYSEEMVKKASTKYIEDNKFEIKQFLGKRGDVLIWHGNVLHQGSVPKNPELFRKSIIAHYSGVNHRPDFPKEHLKSTETGGKYQWFDLPLQWKEYHAKKK